MINAELLPAVVLKRKAVVYVRQSTQAQVQMNLESQRRQYDLVGEARRLPPAESPVTATFRNPISTSWR